MIEPLFTRRAVASLICTATLLLLLSMPIAVRAAGIDADLQEAIARQAVKDNEGFWKNVAQNDPYESMSARKLFAYALALSEARVHPERLERLFELATRMQDRAPESPGYGNLRWYWRDDRVTDRNAVEFCMQDAVLIHTRSREWLPERARRLLDELVQYGIEGCLRHRVRTSYTNIALLNASNLIVLGEALGRSDAAREGYRRLDAFCLWTWQFGTYEYCSPTYYHPDLNGLLLIEAHAGRQSAVEQARALAEVFWSDVALNWFEPARRLAGAQSRSYDYLYGLGGLDRHLWLHGWLDGEMIEANSLIQPSLDSWVPPEHLRPLSTDRLPRLVRQSWGPALAQSRTHMMYDDVTLSCSAAAYGLQDVPMTVDLPGDRSQIRCYFIADGREDPYGKRKYNTGSAGHMKALHLWPFWTAAQRGPDALGLVVYRDGDLDAEIVENVQSHFVLRQTSDGIWLRGNRLELPSATPEKQARWSIAQGDPLVVRYGTAAVGLRVVWSAAQDGREAPAALVDDGNPFGALRVTVDHRSEHTGSQPGAAIWIRVGTALKSDEAFAAWREKFERDEPSEAELSPERIAVEVPGTQGVVRIRAEEPFGRGGQVELVPEPSRAVLELDGQDVGRPLLESIKPVLAYSERINSLETIEVPADGGVYFEAEAGLPFPGMIDAPDAEASAGRCVWQPADGGTGSSSGTVTWPLHVERGGSYWLWGRVWADTGKTDSFYVQVLDRDGLILIPPGAWHTGHRSRWSWEPMTLDLAKQPTPLELSAGAANLVLGVREPGTKIDRLFITSNKNDVPE